MGNKGIKASTGLYLLFTAALLLIPLPWLLAIVTAAAVHESGHYLAIRACTDRKVGVQLFANGARMRLPEMECWQECLCALAGPALGLCLLFLGRWFPRTAICAVAQSVFNLLPIYPLDGGRALRCLLSAVRPPPSAMRICINVETVCRFAVLVAAVYASFFVGLGPIPLVVAGWMLFRIK